MQFRNLCESGRSRACALLCRYRSVSTPATLFSLSKETKLDSVKTILDLPDELPAFSASMLKLCRWMADYYCCSWGEALQCAVPAGMRIGTKMQYTLVEEQMHQGRFTERQKAVIAALYGKASVPEKALVKTAGAQALSNTIQALVRRGVVIAEASVKSSTASIRTETHAHIVDAAVPDNDGLSTLQRRAPKQAAVYLDLLHGAGTAAATALYEKHHVNASTLKSLEQRGLIERYEQELYRRPEQAGHRHRPEARAQRGTASILRCDGGLARSRRIPDLPAARHHG